MLGLLIVDRLATDKPLDRKDLSVQRRSTGDGVEQRAAVRRCAGCSRTRKYSQFCRLKSSPIQDDPRSGPSARGDRRAVALMFCDIAATKAQRRVGAEVVRG